MSNIRTFAIPQLYDLIDRPRLYKLLNSNRDKQLILVQGQAAQGKSTLIASYLSRYVLTSTSDSCLGSESLKIIPVWLNLSQRESDHTNLFDLIINALLQTNIVGNIKSLLPATLGAGEDSVRQTDTLISILDSISTPVALVLDNLESLDSSASSYQLIQSIINHTVKLQLFLISREFPPLNIAKIKMEHGSLIIQNQDLAFTLEETEQFLKSHYKPDNSQNCAISLDVVKKIHRITEGWPGGVALISESISRLEVSLSDSKDGGVLLLNSNVDSMPIHLTSETLDYFSNEVYGFLPENVKKFLMIASIFDEIDEEMALNLCDTQNGNEILTYLEKRNLFIQRLIYSRATSKFTTLNNHPPVCYRFNNLFKQFLFKALIKSISSEELKALNIRAAQLFEKRGEIELAVRYYLDGQDYNMASDMVKKCATDLIVRGRFTDLSEWIEALPQYLVNADPWLIYYLTVTRRIRGGKRNVEDFLTALNLFEEIGNIRGSMLATAHLIEAAVFVRKSPSKILEWIKKGESLLLNLTESHYFNYARAILWQQIAFGYIAGEVDILKGLSSCKNARILAKRVKNREIELNASIVMAFGYVRAGNFTGASALLHEIEPLTNEDIHPEYRVLNHIIRVDFAIKQGDFKRAEDYLQESETDVERFGLIFLYPEFIELKAMHRIYTGRFKEALSIADHLCDFSILSGNNFYFGLAHHIKAMTHYHLGCFNSFKNIDSDSQDLFREAQIESEKSLSLFNEKGEGKGGEDSRFFAAKTLHGLILMRQQYYEDAKIELLEAFHYFDTGLSSGVSWCETKAALGLLDWREHQLNQLNSSKELYLDRAKKQILTALNRAFEEGYERFATISPADFSQIVLLGVAFDESNSLLKALSPLITGQQHQIAYITNLLSSFYLMGDLNAINRLKHIYRLTLPKVNIKTLGGFLVSINNQPVADNIWEGNKPKLLLKSIICHNTREVSKDIIIDDIWPDAPMKSGEKSFKINLHRLRKVLEPDVNKQVGYSYITMEAGRVSLDSELVTVDIDTFINLAKQGYESLARDEVLLALSFFERAAECYMGDFLAEESYEEWIDLKRDSLKRYYIEMLMVMARVYEEQEQPFQAVEYLKKAIQADPLHEEAYQNLMIVYADAGMVKAATALYERWRQIAINELGVEPDLETQNIYKKITALNFKKDKMVKF
ncbi:MAG: hypothetical protein HQK64_08955 [Desulfamplus sp.]|nr:hypothetical protein [Desulfamplus sp.]